MGFIGDIFGFGGNDYPEPKETASDILAKYQVEQAKKVNPLLMSTIGKLASSAGIKNYPDFPETLDPLAKYNTDLAGWNTKNTTWKDYLQNPAKYSSPPVAPGEMPQPPQTPENVSTYGAFTSPEEQTMLSAQMRVSLEQIDSQAHEYANKLMSQGTPMNEANARAANWAQEQKSRSRLDAEANLRQASVGAQTQRLEDLLSILSGVTPKVNMTATDPNQAAALQFAQYQYQQQQQSDMWGSIASLAGAFGTRKGIGASQHPMSTLGSLAGLIGLF